MNALDYFFDAAAAAAYVTRRAGDAAKVLNLLKWSEQPCVHGVLRAELYGHSILWDVTGTKLHTFHTEYEVLPKGADDYELGNLQQVVAFILARNW